MAASSIPTIVTSPVGVVSASSNDRVPIITLPDTVEQLAAMKMGLLEMRMRTNPSDKIASEWKPTQFDDELSSLERIAVAMSALAATLTTAAKDGNFTEVYDAIGAVEDIVMTRAHKVYKTAHYGSSGFEVRSRPDSELDTPPEAAPVFVGSGGSTFLKVPAPAPKLRKLTLETLMQMNHDWASSMIRTDPHYFTQLLGVQRPPLLWIGCSDSRVPANTVVGLKPGEVFVHRNIANMCNHSDFNFLSVVQYAVDVLKVKHILVVGHYGCGGVAASIGAATNGLVDNWIRNLRDIHSLRRKQFDLLETPAKLDRLCELNSVRNALNVGQTTVLHGAWDRGQEIEVHALVYSLATGLLSDMNVTMRSADDVYRMNELFHMDCLPSPKTFEDYRIVDPIVAAAAKVAAVAAARGEGSSEASAEASSPDDPCCAHDRA